ncbi:MAG: FtsW/RodA/SpoVE family cell cycle protein [Gemmatimonadales bacterium]
MIPATGVTLPFISYGRSSLIVTLAATGVLASVARARRAS